MTAKVFWHPQKPSSLQINPIAFWAPPTRQKVNYYYSFKQKPFKMKALFLSYVSVKKGNNAYIVFLSSHDFHTSSHSHVFFGMGSVALNEEPWKDRNRLLLPFPNLGMQFLVICSLVHCFLPLQHTHDTAVSKAIPKILVTLEALTHLLPDYRQSGWLHATVTSWELAGHLHTSHSCCFCPHSSCSEVQQLSQIYLLVNLILYLQQIPKGNGILFPSLSSHIIWGCKGSSIGCLSFHLFTCSPSHKTIWTQHMTCRTRRLLTNS